MKLCFSLEIYESRDSHVNQISHIRDKCPKFSLISGSYISFNIYKYICIHESRKDPVGRKKTSGRRKNRKRKVWSINIVNIHYMQKLFVLSGTELETSLLLSSFNSRRKDGILWNAIFWPYHGQHGKSWTLSICSHIHKIWSRLYLSAFPHIRWKAVRHLLIAEKVLSQLLVAMDMGSQSPSLLLGPVCRWLLYNRQIFSSVV